MKEFIIRWLPPFVTICFYFMRLVELGTRRQTIAGQIRENTTLRIFFLIGSLMLAGSMFEYLHFHPYASWPFFAAGVVVGLSSFYIRRQAIAALGRFWSLHVEIRDTHELVRSGPFRFVRHPAYTSMILEILSAALLLRSWRTAIPVFLAFIPTLLARIRIEEKALIGKFGDKYREFRRTTPALVPGLKFLS